MSNMLYNKKFNKSVCYDSFGSTMPGRNYQSSSSYRYGMNGQEKDDEIVGSGNIYTAPFWEYDARIGRRWNLDPKPNPSISYYATFANNPIWFSDPLGDTIVVNLFDKDRDSETFHNVAKTAVLNQVDDGVFLVFGHSHSGGIQYTDKNGKLQLAQNSKEFNKVMSEKSPEFRKSVKNGKEMVIKINSCNAASEEYVSHSGKVIKRENTIAEKISEGLPNSSVIAADGYVWYGQKNGKPAILGVQQTSGEQPQNTGTGGFVTFKNGKAVGKQRMSFDNKTGTTTTGPKKKLKDE